MAITLNSLPMPKAALAPAAALPPVSMLDGPSLDGASATASPFQTVLADAVNRVQSFQAASETSIGQYLNGADVDLHQVALDVEKAETSFELFSEVRNKVVQAYQEMMRLQV